MDRATACCADAAGAAAGLAVATNRRARSSSLALIAKPRSSALLFAVKRKCDPSHIQPWRNRYTVDFLVDTSLCAAHMTRYLVTALGLVLVSSGGLAFIAHEWNTSAPEASEISVSAETLDADNEAAALAVTRALTEQHYELIQAWLRSNGLLGHRYESIVELAEADEAAAHYVQCHETTKSPTGTISRIELLSVCLRRPPESLQPNLEQSMTSRTR